MPRFLSRVVKMPKDSIPELLPERGTHDVFGQAQLLWLQSPELKIFSVLETQIQIEWSCHSLTFFSFLFSKRRGRHVWRQQRERSLNLAVWVWWHSWLVPTRPGSAVGMGWSQHCLVCRTTPTLKLKGSLPWLKWNIRISAFTFMCVFFFEYIIYIYIHRISIYLEPRDSTRKWMTSMTSKVRLSESQWQQLQGLVQWTRPTATGLQWDWIFHLLGCQHLTMT